jgi:hypothetical protein
LDIFYIHFESKYNHVTEPAFRAFVGPELCVMLLPALNRSQIVSGSLAGEIYVAENENNSIIGGAVWFGPGRDLYDRFAYHPFLGMPFLQKI